MSGIKQRMGICKDLKLKRHTALGLGFSSRASYLLEGRVKAKAFCTEPVWRAWLFTLHGVYSDHRTIDCFGLEETLEII